MTTQVKFKHRDGFNGYDDHRVATGTYNKDGTFTVEIPSKSGRGTDTLTWWTPEDAQKLFERGLWIKLEPEVIKFTCASSDTIYTATIEPDELRCDVTWTWDSGNRGSASYYVEVVREHLRRGDWRQVVPASWGEYAGEYVDVPEPQPEPTDLDKARTLIGEQNLMVIMNGDNYQVDGFNSYKAKNDAELLKICQLLEELKQYE